MEEKHVISMKITVRAFIYNNSSLLLCKNKASKDNFWCLPGGRLEGDETLKEGLVRELFEEFGIKAEVGQLINIREFKLDGTNYIEFYFHIKNSQDFGSINLENASHGFEIEELAYFTIDEIKGLNLKPEKLKELLPKYIAKDFDVGIAYFET